MPRPAAQPRKKGGWSAKPVGRGVAGPGQHIGGVGCFCAQRASSRWWGPSAGFGYTAQSTQSSQAGKAATRAARRAFARLWHEEHSVDQHHRCRHYLRRKEGGRWCQWVSYSCAGQAETRRYCEKPLEDRGPSEPATLPALPWRQANHQAGWQDRMPRCSGRLHPAPSAPRQWQAQPPAQLPNPRPPPGARAPGRPL